MTPKHTTRTTSYAADRFEVGPWMTRANEPRRLEGRRRATPLDWYWALAVVFCASCWAAIAYGLHALIG